MFPKQSTDYVSNQRLFRRLLIAAGVGFAGLLMIVALVSGIYQYLSVKSEDFIQAIQNRTGLEIHVGHKTVGLRQIDFHNVSVSGTPGSYIRQLKATTDLSEAQLELLKVDGAVINITTKQLQQMAEMFAPQAGLKSALSYVTPKARMIPQELNVEIPKLGVWHNGELIFVINHLSIRHSEKDGHGHLKFNGIEVYGEKFLPEGFANFEGRFKSGDFRIRLQSKDPAGRDVVVLSGMYSNQIKQASLRIRTNGVNWGAIPGVADHLVNYRSMPVTLNSNIKLDQKSSVLISWNASTRDAAIFHPKLAKQILSPLALDSQGQMAFDLKGREVQIFNSQWKIGRQPHQQFTIHAALKVANKGTRQGSLIAGMIKFPHTLCQNILDALPNDDGDIFDEFHSASGMAGGSLRFKFNTNDLSKFALKISDDVLNCKFRSDNPRFHVTRLMERKPIISSFQLANRFLSSYSQPSFVKLDGIPSYVRDAFLISEDVGFYRHNGFSFETFEAALRRNLKEGRITLGASTITMQTAKNLWLSGEKTLLRKLQEALLTIYLEDVLSKDRILEMYLNMVEFGPGLYGLNNAADHFFDKKVHELNSLEAVYLASLLPSPVRRYANFCRGSISDEYRKLIDQKLKWMVQFNHLDQSDYEAAKQAPLVFDQSNRESAINCPAEVLRYSSNATN